MIRTCYLYPVRHFRINPYVCSGVAGGVVAQKYFQLQFGLRTGTTVDQARVDALSSNVVSVLQAGAFFGALGSAPISSEHHASSNPFPTAFP